MDISLVSFDLPLKDHHKEIKNDDVIVLGQEAMNQRYRPEVKDRIKDEVVCYCYSFLVLAEIRGLFIR
jgi:NAD(P)H-flavin reductase